MPYTPKDYLENYLRTTLEHLKKAIYISVGDLAMTAWWTKEPVPFNKRTTGKKIELKTGDKWGNLFDCAWFHFTGVVPKTATGEKIVLLIDINGEACVVDKQENPVRGLTNIASQFAYELGMPGKRVLQFLPKAKGGEKVDIWADAGCNDLFGNMKENGTVKEAKIAICYEEIRQLYYDFKFLYEVTTLISPQSARHQQIMGALNEAADQLKNYTEEEAKAARNILARELNKKGGDPSLRVSAIGHAHIDLAWLWPIRETFRKGARTFATVLELMERYPDYVYGASQPQLYDWMKKEYPALYTRIKNKIAAGKIDLLGGAWVEMDTNISGAESLVRQLLYGKRFFRKEFGKEVKNLWLPDAFGYTGALPQICKKAGIDYFVTTKMSWSVVNQMPHHTFFWQGIDGTKILAHMPPESTYNSSGAPRAIFKSEKEYLDKMVSDRCMVIFGIGDGGGGPGPEHLEYMKREKDFNGLAPVTMEKVDTFFQDLEKDQDKFKTWVGEMYLERHQGTLTTQARNKRFNRKMEYALREAELKLVLASLFAGSDYPQDELETIWKEVLLYQFHDILPGSSITRVYEESIPRYEKLLKTTEELIQKAEKTIQSHINTYGIKKPYLVSNSLSWEVSRWVKIEGKWAYVTIPAMGYTVIDLAEINNPVPALKATSRLLENDILKVTVSLDGSISSVYDKVNKREALLPNRSGNNLTVYEDKGDAWDFNLNYYEKPLGCFSLQSSHAELDGPEAILTQHYTFGESVLTERIILTAGSRKLDFVTTVDWKETHKMLRTSFPVDVQARQASFDIQFGYLQRPTSRNTSWEIAQFEVPGQKYADISEGGYGVALLNDCKYGYRVEGNILDLNLLRSPTYPDLVADKARHEFTYSLYPHEGDHLAGGVILVSYELNIPVRVTKLKASSGQLTSEFSFCQLKAKNIVIETIKKAEDEKALIIRLYESHGIRTKTGLSFGLPITSAQIVNLLEEQPVPLKIQDNIVALSFNPFEILTLKLKI